MKLTTAIDTATALLAPDTPILWAGPPGIGKTDATVQVALNTGRRHMAFHPVTRLPEDNALPRIVETPQGLTAKWFAVGELAELVKPDCPPTLLLIDDIAQARAPMQAFVMHLTLARQVADQHLSPNVSIMLCANRRSHDPLAANDLSSALANRLWVQDIQHDYEGFARWIIERPQHDPIVASYALWRRDCFAETIPDDDGIPVFCTPRSLAGAAVGLKRLPQMDKETLAGRIGDTVAGDLILYRDTLEDLIPFDEVMRQPGFLKQMGDPGLVYAYLVQAAVRAQSDPEPVRVWASKLHGELRETLQLLAPNL